MLTTKMQLPGAAGYDSQMAVNDLTVNTDISLSGLFQKHLSDLTHKYGVMDQGKDIKHSSKLKWGERDYHVQDSKDVSYTSFKISCETTQFPVFSFCGSYPKPHGVIGLSKHYNLRLDPKFGHGKCEI